MGKYGQAALSSVMYIQSGQVDNPIDAWKKATIDIFGAGTPSQAKGCPRNTFVFGNINFLQSGT